MDIWKHGTYVDLWSVVHILSGFVLSGALSWAGYTLIQSALYSLGLLLAWELFEWLMGIIEPSMNVVVDILVGLLGFSVGAYVYFVLELPLYPSFFIALAVTLILSVWGFVDFKKRGYR
ncbi:MAG: hypothetical protein RIQ41_184 [Candidatus Parcubacteria bacterium]|jgi:hypothetical protein